jgi:predicted alpha-1,2-mannosidase
VKCISPYYYKDTRIQGFRGTHFWSGSCTQDYGSVTIMPMTGELKTSPLARADSFKRDQERVSPALYSVLLENYGIRAQMAAGSRAAILRFTFPASERAWIVVNPNQRLGEAQIQIRPLSREIVGFNPVHRIYQGSGKPAGFSGWFVVQFDKAFSRYGTWSGDDVNEGATTAKGDRGLPGAFAGFATKAGEVVHARIGMSFTSLEEARRNLASEIPDWDFDGLVASTRAAWERRLGGVLLRGGTDEQRTIFYTALWHALLMPRTFSDADGTYVGFAGEGREHKAEGFDYYCDFSLWDTFRAQHPLLILLESPKRVSDMVRSLISKAEQGGWLPNFPGWNSYTSAMVGDHAVSMITDAYVKGIRGFDAEKAYAFMKKNATEVNTDYASYADGRGRRSLGAYLKFGFYPLEEPVQDAFHKREQVSRTLEYAYDDFVLSRMAEALGKKDDAAIFAKRALNYRNVFDAQTGFVRGRHQDGSWAEPFDPTKEQPYITEGTPWHYSWFVPHDVAGLIGLMGGGEAFVAKLDTFFEKNLYWHGNEPGHQIAYLYDWAGAPWKTQNRVREIVKKEYTLGPSGISGNDDTGQMSAWYVFAALGFYPVCPGVPFYAIGSPLFEEAAVRLGNDQRFTIRARNNSDANRYIQSARLNGRSWNRPWVSHDDIARGGTLELTMGPKPNPRWGADPSAAPPSMTKPGARP